MVDRTWSITDTNPFRSVHCNGAIIIIIIIIGFGAHLYYMPRTTHLHNFQYSTVSVVLYRASIPNTEYSIERKCRGTLCALSIHSNGLKHAFYDVFVSQSRNSFSFGNKVATNCADTMRRITQTYIWRRYDDTNTNIVGSRCCRRRRAAYIHKNRLIFGKCIWNSFFFYFLWMSDNWPSVQSM